MHSLRYLNHKLPTNFLKLHSRRNIIDKAYLSKDLFSLLLNFVLQNKITHQKSFTFKFREH